MAEQSESIKKAVVTLRELSEDEKIRLQCEARERYQMDWQSSMRTSREKGREEGREEGRESGRKEGELQKAHDVAEALLEEGMEIEKIAEILKISPTDVQKWISETK